MKILVAKKFIIPFESGVIVIRHWRMNNYLRNDRHTPTVYQDELSKLCVENDTYELESIEKSTMLPSGIPMVDTDKISIDKISIDKISKEKSIEKKVGKKFIPPTLSEVEDYVSEKKLNVDAKKFFDYFTTGNWIDSRGQKVKNWKQKLLTWNNHNSTKEQITTNPFIQILQEGTQ